MDWDDIRHFIAVAETGSTLAAGRRLRVSQTTAARRVSALEETLGLTLFERRPAGYLLTPAGEALLTHARDAQGSLGRMADAAALLGRTAGGTVRVTMSPLFATTFMAPIVRDLQRAHPAIRIEIDDSEEIRDLTAGEVDVALRVSKRLNGGGLVARRLTDDPWTVYCSRAYAAEHGVPRHRDEFATHPFIGGGEPGVWRYYRLWLEEYALEDRVIMHHGSSTGLLAGIRAGMGLAVLPCIVGDNESDLIRCVPPIPDTDLSLWLVYHERFRQEPRIRTVIDFLAARVPRFTG